ELALDRAGDRGRHGVRARARERGRDLDGREVDRRKRRDRQQAIGEKSENDQRRRHQRRHDGTPDTGLGDLHGGYAPALRIVTFAPSVSSKCPLVTTVSPPSRPESMTDSAPTTRPMVTLRTFATPSRTTKTKLPCWLTCTAAVGTTIAF